MDGIYKGSMLWLRGPVLLDIMDFDQGARGQPVGNALVRREAWGAPAGTL